MIKPRNKRFDERWFQSKAVSDLELYASFVALLPAYSTKGPVPLTNVRASKPTRSIISSGIFQYFAGGNVHWGLFSFSCVAACGETLPTQFAGPPNGGLTQALAGITFHVQCA